MTFLLNSYRLAYYLVGKNGKESIPDSVRNIVSNDQHSLFLAEWKDGTKWFIKQPFSVYQIEKFGIVNEARVSKLMGAFASLQHYVPDYVHYDPVHKILITTFFPEYSSLSKNSGVLISHLLMDSDLAEKAGKMMAAIHIHLTDTVKSSISELPFYLFKPPFLDYTMAFLNPMLESRSVSLLKRKWFASLILQTRVSETLLDLSHSWRSDCMIHGDASSDNILVRLKDNQAGQIKLCDWEFAGWGDADWDAACFFQEFIYAYMDMRINHAMLKEACKRYYQAYFAIFPTNDDLALFETWFVRVLKLAVVGMIEKLLDRILNLKTNQSKNMTERLEFLINSVLINTNLFYSF